MATVTDFQNIVPQRTLRYWLERGYIQGRRYVGGWTVDPKDIIEYITVSTLFRAVRTRKPVYVLVFKNIGEHLDWEIFEEYTRTVSFSELARSLEQRMTEPVYYIGAFPSREVALAVAELLWQKYLVKDSTEWLYWSEYTS